MLEEELCTKEVVPCELSRYMEVPEDKRYEKSEWSGLIFEGDTVDSELLVQGDKSSIKNDGLKTEEGEIQRTGWFSNGWWEECMSFRNRQTVAQCEIDLVDVRSGISTIDGRTRKEIQKERYDQELALAFLGDGKCAKIERRSDGECSVLSVGSLELRESDICKDCTEGDYETQQYNRAKVARHTNLLPSIVVHSCVSNSDALQLFGLTSGCMWIRKPSEDIDHLLEYRLV